MSSMIYFTGMRELHNLLEMNFINKTGQILDCILILYFIHNFFEVRPKIWKRLWILAIPLYTGFIWFTDYLSGNNKDFWYLCLFVFPLIYAIVFYKGHILIKAIMCLMIGTALTYLEQVGVYLMRLIAYGKYVPYIEIVALYAVRRIVFKLFFLILILAMIRHADKKFTQKLSLQWILLGAISVCEFLLLFFSNDISMNMNSNQLLMIVFLFSLCAFVPVLIYYIICMTEERIKETQLSTIEQSYLIIQEQFMSQILKAQDSLRQFRHDYNSHLFIIDSLIEEENYSELHDYLNRMHQFTKEIDIFYSYTNDKRIDVILNQKVSKAHSFDIKCTIQAEPLTIHQIPYYDINILLSNLCDNAIEASQKSKEKEVHMSIARERGYLKIDIINSTLGNPLVDNPEFDTSKEEKELHGFGMSIIKDIVDRHHGNIMYKGDEGWLEICVLVLDEEM